MAQPTFEQQARVLALRQARQNTAAPRQKNVRTPSSRPSMLAYGAAGIIAGISDGFDFILGWIPLLGDILDLMVGGTLLVIFLARYLARFRLKALIPVGIVFVALLVEFIPLVDILPTWLGALFLAWRWEQKSEQASKTASRITSRLPIRTPDRAEHSRLAA